MNKLQDLAIGTRLEMVFHKFGFNPDNAERTLEIKQSKNCAFRTKQNTLVWIEYPKVKDITFDGDLIHIRGRQSTGDDSILLTYKIIG